MVRQNSPQVVRVRIAPSPTGIPHIGTTRTALYNYLFAQKNKGVFILRIEDTDRERFVDGAEEKLHEILEWLSLPFEEKYKQSERLEIYKKHADELLKNGFAYKDQEAIRFKMPKKGQTSWIDQVGNKLISFENKDQEDFIILKSDGYPTYNFANVIDDHLMHISHVIRGQEFISSTPKHIQLYKAFSWDHPEFAHLPLVLGHDRQKLSKRHGAKSALDYRDEGYLPEAINNYMALLGWNPGGDKEIISMEEMIDLFDLKDINVGSPIFDPQKLLWMNGEYIRKSQISNLKSQILLQDSKVKELKDNLFDALILLAHTRMNTLNDFYNLTGFIFEKQDVILTDKEKQIADLLVKELSTINQWNNEAIFVALKKILVELNIKMHILYKVITGKEHGLPLPQVLEIIGKEKTISLLTKSTGSK